MSAPPEKPKKDRKARSPKKAKEKEGKVREAKGGKAVKREGDVPPDESPKKPKAAGHKKQVGKAVIKNEDEASNVVLSLMQRENRPYNAQLVSDNTAGSVKKQLAQKILDDLVADGRLVAKDFGKNRVYMPNQASITLDPDEAAGLDSTLSELRCEVDAVARAVKELQDEAKAFKGIKSVKDLQNALLDSQRKEEELTSRVQRCSGKGDEAYDQSTSRKVVRAYMKCRDQWRKRKRVCIEMLHAMVSEAKSYDALVRELGIESDESAGVRYEDGELALPPGLVP